MFISFRSLLISTAVAALAVSASAQSTAVAPPPAAAPAQTSDKKTVPDAYSVAGDVNAELPSWLRFGGEYRVRVESGTNAKGAESADDAYTLSRLRLDLTFRLGNHVRLFAQGQDAQVWHHDAHPDPSTLQDRFDLRQAWVEFRQAEKTGWGLRLGRQELSFGDQRLVGVGYWTNVGRSFDAARLSYTDARVGLDVFAASVVVPTDGAFNKHVDGQNFYGAYASAFKVVPRAQLDGYVFWRTAPFVLPEAGPGGDADTWTFGSRVAGTLPHRADYTVEVIRQLGTFAADDVRAGAAYARIAWATSSRAVMPKLRLDYTYASGDVSPGDGVRGTFDQLYPTNHDRYGVMDLVGTKNIHALRAGASIKPTPRLTLDASYHSFWLAHRRDGFYDSAGALVARIPTGAPDAHVAQEADVEGTYAVATNVAFGAGYGHWFPGAFWRAATPGAGRDFLYTFVTYTF
jgi:hypothetical protein